MARQYEEEVAIVGVAGEDDVESFEEFVEQHDLGHMPHIADTEGSVAGHFGISGQPAWVFVDAETGESDTVFGEHGVDAMIERIEQ